MRIRTDTRDLARALSQLNGAGERVRDGWAVVAKDVGEQAVGFIKKEFRSGPTSKTTTQVRSNRLRASYDSAVKRTRGGVDLDVGLIRAGTTTDALQYGRMMEGFNADGSKFRTKVIRAKNGGWLTFPILDPNVPGVAKTNRLGWVRVKQVTFRPRPSFPATQAKFEPILRDESRDVLAKVAAGI